jgi:hypothetical protein
LAPALGVMLFTLVAAAGQPHATVATQEPTAAPTAAAPDSLTATVRSVREGGIEVITNVQYAIKLTFIAIDSTTVINKQGETIAMQRLEPGDIITIRYQETEQGKVAQSIIVEPPRQEGGR